MPSRDVSRREFIGAAAIAVAGSPILFGRAYSAFAAGQGPSYTPPVSPRTTLNFNLDWKFIREDVPGGEVTAFDDSKWATVSTPHTFNDVDSFRQLISHGGGDRGTYKGLSWYRKHFRLAADLAGHKIFLEFEGMRQAGDIFLNGKQIGLCENGITAYGLTSPMRRTSGPRRTYSRSRSTTRLPTRNAPQASLLNGMRTISTPTTAASTGTSGCT
jgi:beta-galactosidase